MAPQPSDFPLYKRLGGYDVIARVIDDLFGLMRTDPRFSRFGAGRSFDSHQRARQLTVDMVCHLAGGPCFYIGRDMKTSHAGLGITEEEWEVNLQYTRQALIKNGIGEREQGEFLALFERYREEIVENKAAAQHR
jgi:hemoglobin